MRILVLEDERRLAPHITQALPRFGHSAAPFHDGAGGLKAAIEHLPDLIVHDLE